MRAAAGREGGGKEQGADCLPASPPQRPLGSHENTEKRSCPRESLVPAGALSMLSRVRGEGSTGAPKAVTEPAVAGTRAGLAAALCGSEQRTPNPGGGARAVLEAGGACGRGSREPPAPRRPDGDAQGTRRWAHVSHMPLLNGGANMQRWESTQGPRHTLSPPRKEQGPADIPGACSMDRTPGAATGSFC